jgi:thiol-disulfide isomerase/thioredoxin
MDRETAASSNRGPTAPTRAAARRALVASPQALAALHEQSSQLLGGTDLLMTRLRSLRGYPVVLNAWASWCAPCRGEFPMFATASATYGRQVAFLGVNTKLPSTVFINRAGRVVDVHAGQYDTQGTLDNDVERYALSR